MQCPFIGAMHSRLPWRDRCCRPLQHLSNTFQHLFNTFSTPFNTCPTPFNTFQHLHFRSCLGVPEHLEQPLQGVVLAHFYVSPAIPVRGHVRPYLPPRL